MAFTDKTWAFQEGLESADFNLIIRDNLRFVRPLTARTTGNVSAPTTTFVDATGITFAIGASETWTFQLDTEIHINGNSDFKSRWNMPSGATGRHWYTGAALGDSTASITADLVAASAGTANFVCQFGGVVINSTNAGTMQWQIAQFSSDADPVVLQANSVLVATRMA